LPDPGFFPSTQRPAPSLYGDRIDVLLTTFPEQGRVVHLCHQQNIPVIAEKVETEEQFRQCLQIGYDYFQGYFFCRPQIVARRSIPANKTVYIQLLQAANTSEFDIHRIPSIFRRDVSLSYRLLRYLNSAAFALQREFIPYLTRSHCWANEPCANGYR
jgi:c-di-GMP phosphodiesterase